MGATAGGIVAHNVAQSKGATGWELVGWTLLGVLGGAVVGAAIGAGVGALTTKITGVVGFSITKYSIIPIKSVTVLGNMPGYIAAATTTSSGFYKIAEQLWTNLSDVQRWANNMQYLKDAYALGSQFVLVPDWVINAGTTFWKEIQYLVNNVIPWILH